MKCSCKLYTLFAPWIHVSVQITIFIFKRFLNIFFFKGLSVFRLNFLGGKLHHITCLLTLPCHRMSTFWHYSNRLTDTYTVMRIRSTFTFVHVCCTTWLFQWLVAPHDFSPETSIVQACSLYIEYVFSWTENATLNLDAKRTRHNVV